VIDPFTEIRMAEYQARAQREQRCVLTDPSGAVAPTLRDIGSSHGYRALGLSAEDDQITLRSDSLALNFGGAPAEEAATLSGHPGLIDDVFVNGRQVVQGGRHLGSEPTPG
jgi:cytosine/adenosine deaminase-related metal-dependent hydrolase